MGKLFRVTVSIAVAVITGACSDAARSFDGSNAVVEVIETPPPIELVEVPSAPAVLATLEPQLTFVETLPLPARHTVHVSFEPAHARTLGEVQSIEVDVDVEGGPVGTRVVHAVFVSPQGFAWEKQPGTIDAKPGEVQRAHFSLPVASTMITEQRLFGAWQVTTLDDGVEHASAAFALEE